MTLNTLLGTACFGIAGLALLSPTQLVAQQVTAKLARLDGAADAASVTKIDLKTKVYRAWKIRLPAESWCKVGKGLKIGAWKDTVFKTQLDGTSLQVDTDADGEFDVTVEKTGGVITLIKGDSRFAVRLRSAPDWSFAPASVKSGKIGKTRVRLIDQNNNGRYDDFGADAMIIGSGKSASFLSKVVSVGGELYSISVEADGSGLGFARYEGETSEIDFKVLSKGKVLAAVLRSTDGQHSFEISGAKGALTVPTSSYQIHSGLLSFGGNKVSLRKGNSKPLELSADKPTELRLGGPVHVEFDYKVLAGNKYQFSPDAIYYYGRSGEEYYNWQPLGKSPVITIDDPATSQQIAEVIFPPNC